MCLLRHNFTVQHPGSCEGFPFQRGRRHMPHIPSLGYSHCEKWLAFSSLHKPLFSEHDSVYFANAQHPPSDYNNAYCKVSMIQLPMNNLGFFPYGVVK
ncbi:hypothetical protein OS493_031945 [Desmophyllum pertusum]|uniref:Uncharacterized protein n=1 Tax=Desmophyllum pertusum TaxID=174260 RepID=A0A9X0D0P3_9CNID|nr:hypothetical protein OS493_031945 [Desmophyllum pertusum]